MDRILGHKTNLIKFKSIEIISSVFSDHHGTKVEINYRRKNKKKIKKWRLNNMLVKNQQVNDDIKEGKYVNPNENEYTTLSNLCGDTDIHSETRRISNDQTNLSSKELEKKEQAKPKVSRRKEIIKCKVNKLKKKSIREDKENHFF